VKNDEIRNDGFQYLNNFLLAKANSVFLFILIDLFESGLKIFQIHPNFKRLPTYLIILLHFEVFQLYYKFTSFLFTQIFSLLQLFNNTFKLYLISNIY